MFGAVLPSYESAESRKETKEAQEKEKNTIKVDDPKNREQVMRIFDAIE